MFHLFKFPKELFVRFISCLCRDNSKKKDVRIMNIEAAKAVADAVRTSLGPRGMDKMVSKVCRQSVFFRLVCSLFPLIISIARA
jgi:hypothetical protein